MNAMATGAPDLTGRVSLVTGATGGVGRVVATELARLGATVVLAGRDAAAGDRLRHQIAAETGTDRAEVIFGRRLPGRVRPHRPAARPAARWGPVPGG